MISFLACIIEELNSELSFLIFDISDIFPNYDKYDMFLLKMANLPSIPVGSCRVFINKVFKQRIIYWFHLFCLSNK